jgi:hypothetical protein
MFLKKMIVLLFFLDFSFAKVNFINYDLLKFIKIISVENNITILVNNDIKEKFNLLISDDINKTTYKDIFVDILAYNNLFILNKNDYFTIESTVMIRKIKFKYLSIKSISSYFTLLFPHIPYVFNEKNKYLSLKSNIKDFNKIKEYFLSIDNK